MRPSPWNEEAERAVCGVVLADGRRALSEVADLVAARDFFDPTLSAILTAALDLDAQSRPVDVITVAEQMRVSDTIGRLRARGGEAFLSELVSAVVTVDNVAFHARLVASKARRRALIEAAQEITAAGYGPGDDDHVLATAETLLARLATNAAPSRTVEIKTLIREVHRRLELRYEQKRAVTGIPTGIAPFDGITTGLHPGRLYLLAARPAMGKTALGLNVAVNAATAGYPVLVFSLEMENADLGERMLASAGGVDSWRMATGQLTGPDFLRIVRAASDLSQLPMTFDDTASLSLRRIRSIARRWRASTKSETGLIVFDYLQLAGRDEDAGKQQNREREVAELSSGLVALAKDLHIPVLALSQLNRAVEQRADRRPMLSDLRESGAIEQDAAVVTFLYRDKVYHSGCETPCQRCAGNQDSAEWIIGKNRFGQLATVNLRFREECTRFEARQ